MEVEMTSIRQHVPNKIPTSDFSHSHGIESQDVEWRALPILCRTIIFFESTSNHSIDVYY